MINQRRKKHNLQETKMTSTAPTIIYSFSFLNGVPPANLSVIILFDWFIMLSKSDYSKFVSFAVVVVGLDLF